MRVKNREAVMLALNQHEVFPGVHYRDNTEYRMFAYGKGTCPHAHQASNEIISLPLHMNLTRHDVMLVAQLVSQYAAT